MTFNSIKQKTMSLRNNVFEVKKVIQKDEYDYQRYAMSDGVDKIFIDNNYVCFNVDKTLYNKEYSTYEDLKSIIRDYVRKSVFNSTICCKYLIFLEKENGHKNTMTFINSRYASNNKIGIIVCKNDMIELIIKNEFIDRFSFEPGFEIKRLTRVI